MYRHNHFARSGDRWNSERRGNELKYKTSKHWPGQNVALLVHKAGPHEAYFTIPPCEQIRVYFFLSFFLSLSLSLSLSSRVLYHIRVLNATRIIGSPFVNNLDIKSALRFTIGVWFHQWCIPGKHARQKFL